MVTLRLRFVVSDRDRHGNVRYYFRRKGEKKVRLHGIPGSKEFMDAYDSALTSVTSRRVTGNFELRSSFGFLCKEYFRSQTFQALNVSTRLWRRRVLEEICEDHGDKPFAKLQPKNVRALRDEKAGTPGAANLRLKALRALFRWAIEYDFAVDNPTRGVEPIRYVTEGHHSWTTEEVEAFNSCHPIGSKARLAFALMLYTGCRRGDVVRTRSTAYPRRTIAISATEKRNSPSSRHRHSRSCRSRRSHQGHTQRAFEFSGDGLRKAVLRRWLWKQVPRMVQPSGPAKLLRPWPS